MSKSVASKNQMATMMSMARRARRAPLPTGNTPSDLDAINSTPKAKPVTSGSRLYVQNLPAYVETKRLREHFATQGEVTDAVVIKTKDGKKSRRFGFVGYKTEQQAVQARAFFDRSFMDTARLNVTFAVTRDDDGTVRPWSKYSVGSSRNQQQQGNNKDANAETAGVNPGKDSKTGKVVADDESPEFHEFMETMQARSKSKFWANDDVQGPDSAAMAAAETAKLLGEDSDEDDEDEAHDLSRNRTQHTDGEDAEKEAAPRKEMSDLDFLRSKMKKNVGSGDAEGISSDSEAEEEQHTRKKTTKDTAKNGNATNAAGASEEPEAVGEGRPTARLFVRNLPFTTVEEDLTDLFSTYGPIIEVHMPLDETKRRKGYGFVLFKSTVDAQAALSALDGFAFQGRRLHVIFARVKPEKVDPETALQNPDLTFKQKKDLERQLQANKQTGWNASFIRSDATVGTLADRMGVKRGDIMDRDQGNMAVRLAIGETMLVKENKEFFAREGVDLDAIEGALVKKTAQQTNKAKVERSTTVILVKNLPHTTEEEELAQLFRKHGDMGRFLLAPSKTLALIEFFEPSEARKAFRSLAYKKYQHVPLYLEWAPVKVFSGISKSANGDGDGPATAAGIKKTPVLPVSADGEQGVDGQSVEEASHTICVKNLNFVTQESALEALFKRCGKVRKVTVARRKDAKRGLLSMGFGFVEFADAKSVDNAIKTLQSSVVDGHALNLVVSQNKAAANKRKAGDADDPTSSGGGRQTKIIVRNVAFEATSNEIRELFAAFGQLKRVRMPKKFDGKHRGFAFVEFLTEQEAQTAFAALASSHLYGRHLVLEWAQDADDMDSLRAKASRDLSAINESDRRKRAKTAKEDAAMADEADY